MPSASALVGLGMPSQLAAALSGDPSALTCTGTAQGTAATILSKLTELLAASSQTGGILPADANVGDVFYVFTSSSTTAVVYAPSGHYLNGSENGSLNVAQNKGAILWQYKKGYWASIVAA